MKSANNNSDIKLRAQVIETICANQQFNQLDIRVGVNKGIVHLGGSAPSIECRQIIEDCVRKISRVRAVVNRIDAPGAPSPSRTVELNINYSFKESEDENKL